MKQLNEKAPQTGVTAESIVRELPLLPVLGFVFALLYEGSFFFSLGIELRQILTLTDIVESSALKILPAVPFLLIGMWIGSELSFEKSETNQQRLANFVVRLYMFLVMFPGVAAATIYLLFGLAPTLGFPLLTMIIVLLFVRVVIFPSLSNTDRKTLFSVLLPIIGAVVFVGMGYTDAHKIRFGDHSQMPLVTTKMVVSDASPDELRLVRRLSSGMLVTAETEDRLWFIQNDSSSVLTFKIDQTPFRGILCGGFDWCPAFLPLTN